MATPPTLVTLEQLAADPHPVHHALRAAAPISWVEALGGWLVTSRELAVEVMRDAARFTVDHPGFTTAQVVGPSMLSLDGPEHARHRDPFAAFFRVAELRRRFVDFVAQRARARVAALRPAGAGELRRELAAPLAVDVVAELLEILDVDPAELLAIYRDIVAAVTDLSAGLPMPATGRDAVAELRELVARSLRGQGMLAQASRQLTEDEVVSNAAVMLFGGIETNEGMTASALWYLLSEPGVLDAVAVDRSLVGPLVEESLRLEPAASRVDRFATRPVTLAGAAIEKDDLVIVSLAAANRDPAVFDDPDSFRLDRAGRDAHVTFALGPHACIGQHLARLETAAAVDAVLDGLPGVAIDAENAAGPHGLVFRKPAAVAVTWQP